MNLQSLIGLGFTLSIFLGVLAVGMRVASTDLRYLWDRPARLARSVLAMNVVAPIVVVLVCKMFSLHPAVTLALVTLAVAPVGALFSQAMLPLVSAEPRAGSMPAPAGFSRPAERARTLT